jgi:hypothetical protein
MRAGLAFYRAAEQNRALSRDQKLTMPVLGLSADKGSIPDISAALRPPFATDVSGFVTSQTVDISSLRTAPGCGGCIGAVFLFMSKCLSFPTFAQLSTLRDKYDWLLPLPLAA